MLGYLYNLATDKYKGIIFWPVKAILFILSLVYAALVKILVLFYRLKPERLYCKVISVGNITLGGTGKTSLVEYICRYLSGQGHKVAILSRGYKTADEPYMLEKNLKDIPVLVDSNRIRAAKKATCDYRVDTVILDDGFQQWRMRKDLEIVTIDAANPFGNCCLLPRGILREPLSSLRRADIFVLTNTNLNSAISKVRDFLARINPQALIVESLHQPVGFYRFGQPQQLMVVSALSGKTAALFCGIGNPGSFENLIAGLGVKIGVSFKFPDHYGYTQEDLEKITKISQEKGIDIIVTTEKDAARLSQLPTPQRLACPPRSVAEVVSCQLSVLILRIELKITKDEERFHNRLLKLYTA